MVCVCCNNQFSLGQAIDLVKFPKPPLKSQSEVGSGVEIRLEFLTEDVHMSSLGNAVISSLRCWVWSIKLHFVWILIILESVSQIHTSNIRFGPVNNSPEGFERTLVEGMFLRRKPERAKLNKPHSSFRGHKQILHLVGAHWFYFVCKWNPLGEMAESGGQPPPALQRC